jgi:CubicO group peptidase (beta-lactamase class C family)
VTSVAGPLGAAIAATLAPLEFSGVVTVLGPDGPMAEVAMGEADRANHLPNRPETRFAIASIGKLFTTVALVRLLDRGRGSLSTRVVDVLPPERRPRALDERVTIEHLLTHTSGMTDYVDEVAGERFEDLWTTWNPAVMRHPADLLPMYADRPPRSAPGVEVRYNNAAFALLGLVVEALAERDYYATIGDEVFRPAGMTSTGFPAIDDIEPGLAVGYHPPDGPGDAWRSNVYMVTARGMPDGGACSTAGDLLRFLDGCLSGRLVSEAWREELLRPRVQDEDAWFGLGFMHLGEGDRTRFGHGGSDPGASARLACYPRVGIRLAMLSNVTEGTSPAFRAVEAALIPDAASGRSI